MSISGECFCGDIKYEIEGELGLVTSCHCSRCRKAFNAQASASAKVDDPGAFRWLSGEDLLSSYVGEHGFGISFCGKCGSTLCTTYKGDVFQITLGCTNGNPGVEIDRHIFVDSKAPWEVMPEGVTCYSEGPPE